MTFRAGGIFSGMDTNSIIEQLVQLERVPIQNLQRRQSTIAQQRAVIGDIETALEELSSLMEGMDDRGSLLSYLASSSNESALTVRASGDAVAGSHSVTIQQLARAEQDRSQAFSAAGDEVKAGTLTITVAGEDAVEVTIEDGDTLADVAYKINTSGARVTAVVVDTGTAAYLTLYAVDTGHQVGGSPSDAVVIQESYSGASGQELSFTETVQAQNARFTFDGLDIERRSNTISDVVEGLELTLLDDGGTPSVTVSVEPDSQQLQDNLQSFIDAYNRAASLLQVQLSYTEGETTPVLFGDGTLRNLAMRLQTVVSEQLGGGTGSFSTLGSVGVKLGEGGLLQLDQSTFDDAVARDFRGIADVFLTADSGAFDHLGGVIDDYTNSVDGLFRYKKEALSDQDDNLAEQIDRMEDRVAAYEQQLVAQFTYMETVIAQLQSQQGSLGSIYSLFSSGE